jgi:predicted enzyme related to lactoylglutathione lyase
MSRLDKAIAGTIVWAELGTSDLEKARAFYGELFGWSFSGGDDPNTGHYTTAEQRGHRIVGLYKQTPEMPGPTAWCCYFGTTDADATASVITAAGGQLLMSPMDVMDYGRMAMCADPSGAVFGIWQSKQHSGAQIRDEPGSMTWHEVYTRDAKRASAFYTRVFGLELRRMEGDMEYWTLHQGDRTVCGLMQMTEQFPKEVPSHWNLYFAVTDTDASEQKLRQLGGQVFQPAFDTPYGRMAAVADPLGAGFCLIKPTYVG